MAFKAETKFNRNYQLTIDPDDRQGEIVVTLPFTIEIDITRTTFSSRNVCQLRVYNLGKEQRNRIRFDNWANLGKPKYVTLKAGYGDNLVEIFKGNISNAWSVREGVNFISQLEMYAGGYGVSVGKTSFGPYPAGTNHDFIIRDVIEKGIPGVSVGAISGEFLLSILPRERSFSGSAVQILNDLTGNAFYIDNGRANALKNNEYIQNTRSLPGINVATNTIIVSPETGLLGTPLREQTIVHFDMLFEPSLNVGTKVNLQAETEDLFNGQYVVKTVKHRGVISEAVSGTLITTAEFQLLDISAKGVSNAIR